MKYQTIAVFAGLQLLLSAGCGSDNGATGDGTGGGTSVVDTCPSLSSDPSGNLQIGADPVNNYSITTHIQFNVVPVKPKTNLSFDWSGLTIDMYDHAINPKTDIGLLTFALWKFDYETVVKKIDEDNFLQRDMAGMGTVYTKGAITSAKYFDLTEVGTPIDPAVLTEYVDDQLFPPDTHTYMIAVAAGETLGKNMRMTAGFKLDPTSTNDKVVIDNKTGTLAINADFHTLKPVQVPVGNPKIVVDWGKMTVNAMGRDFITSQITSVMVASYDIKQTDLEARVKDLWTAPIGKWTGTIESGSKVVLSSLTDEKTGQPFAGIDDTHTWIVALECGACQLPIPWYISIFKPCGT
jgi:hypothetical protein